jgi:hypothetical protein
MSDGGGDDQTPRVRVRGIYTTALTQLLGEHATVVRASEPIRERFDRTFPVEPADAAVETTGERQGVGVTGLPTTVDRLRGWLSVGIDTLSWADPAPAGAVLRGRVTDTLGGGAVLDLGERADGGRPEGYLPYDGVEGYVDEGDRYTVQVTEPAPPWSDDRPRLSTDLTVDGGLVTLRRGRSAGTGEAARLASLLQIDPPEGWGPRWDRGADDAGMDALRESLERATGRAEAVETALEESEGEADEDIGPLVTRTATAWVWFGRESRFALDVARREVTTTMPGHHRTKATDRGASAAVDFAEAVCESFPFAAVTRQFGPREGDRVGIGHGKPDGRLITLGRGEVIDYDPEGGVTVERSMSPGGEYDALGVPRESGDTAVTKFKEGRWWYATSYRDREGSTKGTYVNVCTPLELFPDVVRYVDLHVDVVRHPDGRVERVDDDELDDAVAAGEVPEALAERAREVATHVEGAL